MGPRVFVTGTANIDLTFHIDTPPRAGVTTVYPHFQQGFGGKGANQAVTAARMGAAVTYLAKVGSDAFGTAIKQALTDEGIDVTHVTPAAECPTGTAVILVEPSGQNTIITHAGPNVALTEADVEAALPDLRRSRVLLATLETPGPALLELFRAARAAGVLTILNPAPPVTFPRELLREVDYCVPNESELAALTDIVVDSPDSLRASLAALQRWGPRHVIVTLGERGVAYTTPSGIGVIPPRPVHAIDTTGAGDAFCGTLAVALAEELPLDAALQRATAAAALSVTRPGAQTSFPTRAEIDW